MAHDLKTFLTEQQFETLSVTKIVARPDGLMSDAPMDHWVVTLRRVGFGRWPSLTTFFSKGKGHNGKAPTLVEVVDCLAGDAASIVNASSFEEWASDLGYDEDSRKAHDVWQACRRDTDKLRAFLGEHFETVLFECERL